MGTGDSSGYRKDSSVYRRTLVVVRRTLGYRVL